MKKRGVFSRTAAHSFSRRTLIKSTLASALTLGSIHNACSEPESQKEKAQNSSKPLFRFLQVNDLHIQHEGKTYTDANVRASWLFNALQEERYFPKPDFILGIGDIVHGESLEGIKNDFTYLRENYLDGLSIPFYHIMGNHECKQQEGNPEFEAPFIQANGPDRFNYSFEYKGFEFIAFNNSGTHIVPDKQEFARKETLRKLLQAKPSLPKIVCCHIPLLPIREESVLAESFGFTSYKTKDASTLDVLQASENNVLAVLSGHLHITGAMIKDGIHHISIAGMASYPHDVALYSVFSDRIDVEVIRIRSDLLMPTTNIHGARRHKKDFIDRIHPSYTQYIMGNENERHFSIQI
jgi:hypothetical protein